MLTRVVGLVKPVFPVLPDALLMWNGLFLVVFVCLNVRILLLHGHACEQPQMVIVAVRARKLMRGFFGCSSMPIACSILLFMNGTVALET